MRLTFWALFYKGELDNVAYMALLVAGLLEVGWAAALKASQGFTRLGPTIITIVLLILSFYLLNIALKQFDIGTTYAIFTGIGTAGTATVGMLFLNETISVGKISALFLLLIGIIGLKLIEQPAKGK